MTNEETIEPVELPEVYEGKFFTKLDWSAFWTACILSLIAYCYTLAPTVTLEDSGELAVAGDYLGVPHPPGYPIWTMMAWLFTKIFAFVQYRGQPNPAWSIGLMSAMFGALAAGISAMLICKSGSNMLEDSGDSGGDESRTRRNNVICWLGGVVGSLLFALSPVMWSQSVIVEVYSLNAFFLVLILLLTYKWMCRPTNKLLYITGFVFGLGLTNYQVLLLAALPLLIVIMLRDIGLFRDMVIVGITFVVAIAILELATHGSMVGFPKPALFPKPYTRILVSSARYFGMFLSGLLVVVMCIVLGRRSKESTAWPMIPVALLAIGFLALVVLISQIPKTPIHPTPLQPKQEAFSWGIYLIGFIGAMAVLITLCMFLPKGKFVAIAFVTVEIALAILLRKGVLQGLVHPPNSWMMFIHPADHSWWFTFYVFLNFLILTSAFFLLPHGKTVALTILLAELGVAFYAYMPIVSDLRNPPMNWGYPRTWEGFKHAITRGQYEKIKPADMFSGRFIAQIGAYFTDLRVQFTLPIALLGFLPFCAWRLTIRRIRINALYIAVALSILTSLIVMIGKATGGELSIGLLGAQFSVYKATALPIIAILVVGGLAIMINLVKELANIVIGEIKSSRSEKCSAGMVLLGGLAACFAYVMLLCFKLKDVVDAKDVIQKAALEGKSMGVEQMVLSVLLLMIGPFILVACVGWLTRNKKLGFSMSIDHGSQKWVVATLAGFLVMSILLIALANPKGDIQDNFIQKVKFISSHALYALWIGYGLILGLASVDSLSGVFFKKNPMMQRGSVWLGIGVAALLPLIPLQQNASNEELLRIYGGPEQNGHDFGWQFGNYQLRGAEAIEEELDEDEEPLPNPAYPQEMGPRAIFFGGTDPGRFVPTYMIYSAKVRPDVYLITQNALADGTYMSVMRDLYGDEIWIPAQPDSAKAFERYVREVRSGVRPANAQLKIENGRVQVSGALGVMEINGILAQMIFEYNNYRHNFYVEESYVIRWMYRYLTPHGLIMKINRNPSKLDKKTINMDMDFWDWYTRRLTSNNMFIRDIVARKSFSKLRSALAGLYANPHERKFRESEQAFREAHMLYSLSPEANFRLVHEVLIPQRRIAESMEIMREFQKSDPGNRKVGAFLLQLKGLSGFRKRISELEGKQKTKKQLEITEVLELADLYRKSQDFGMFMRIMASVVNAPNLPPGAYMSAAKMLQGAKRNKEMNSALGKCLASMPKGSPPAMLLDMAQMYHLTKQPQQVVNVLKEYINRAPTDWRAMLNMAGSQIAVRQTEDAVKSAERAVKLGGADAILMINTDRRFNPIRNRVLQRSRTMIGVGPRVGR